MSNTKTVIPKMNAEDTLKFIISCMTMNEIPLVLGQSAIGKSSVVHKAANLANAKMIDIRLSQKLPEDLAGIPDKNADGTKATYLPFDEIPLEGDPIPDGYSGWVVFFDEITSGSEEVWAGMYGILLDRKIGLRNIHPKVRIVTAGNRSTDSAIARALPDTIITRVMVMEMVFQSAPWLRWAKRKDESGGHDAVIDYLENNKGAIMCTAPHTDRSENQPYEQPRGWQRMFKIMHLHDKRVAKESKSEVKEDPSGLPLPKNQSNTPDPKPINTAEFNLMCAAVGMIPARAFRDDYNSSVKIPSNIEIAQAPSSTQIPTTQIGKAKVTSSLSAYYLESSEAIRKNVLTYMNRMGSNEHSALFVEQLREKLSSSPPDIRLIEEVSARLNVNNLNGADGTSGDYNDPF